MFILKAEWMQLLGYRLTQCCSASVLELLPCPILQWCCLKEFSMSSCHSLCCIRGWLARAVFCSSQVRVLLALPFGGNVVDWACALRPSNWWCQWEEVLVLTCLLNAVVLQRSVNLLCLFCKKTTERVTEETENWKSIREQKVLRTPPVHVGRASVSVVS